MITSSIVDFIYFVLLEPVETQIDFPWAKNILVLTADHYFSP